MAPGTESSSPKETATSPGAKPPTSPGVGAASANQHAETFVQTAPEPMTTGQGTAIESDDEEGDDAGASGYGSGESSATTSVSSSIFSFTYANGRRYHSDRFKKADYFMPNDDSEQDRLDLYHHIFLSLLGGKLHAAPLNRPHRVLDVGTGTGIWAIDFADENPQAQIIGTDLSPIQPTWVPPNLKFEIDDMEDTWTYPDNYFDYVHIRSLSGAFKNWDFVLEQVYEKTAPGGYVEFQDYGCEVFTSDGTMLLGPNTGHPIGTFFHYVMGAAERAGRPLIMARSMRNRIRKAGFVDVVQSTAIWPLGPWPKDKNLKEIGKWGKIGTIESLYPFATQLLSREGWTMERISELCEACIKMADKGKYYCHGWFVYGRKPREGEVVEPYVESATD